MKAQNLLVIVNPIAGGGKSRSIYPRFEAFLKSNKLRFFTYQTTGKNDIDSIRRLLDHAEYDAISIVGGDGTINNVVNSIDDRELPLHLIPCGHGNDLTRTLKLTGSLSKQFDLILSAKRKEIDLYSCNNQRFVVAFGVGFDGTVSHYAHKLKNTFLPAQLVYWISVLVNIISFKEIEVQTNYGREKIFLLSLANTPYVGGGFKLAPNAEVSDRLLDLIVISELGPLRRIRNLMKVRNGKHLSLKEVREDRVTALSIHCNKAIPAHIDGEDIMSNSYDIRFARKLAIMC